MMTKPSDIVRVDYRKLHLDIENPRLPASISKNPKEILTWIAESTAIEDLMNAIGSNGYFSGEPVVAYPHPKREGEYIVIEGNRRLTSIRLLHNPHECENPSLRMIRISEETTKKPKDIPVVIRETREEVLPYLGFRHITGVKEWDSLAKARYMKQLFDQEDLETPVNQRYQAVAKSIGSRSDYIKRSMDALAVYQVIEENNFFDIEQLNEETIKFAILSTALADERIGDFVGTVKRVNKGDDEESPFSVTNDAIINPKALKVQRIRELSKWIFARDKGKTVLGESRRIPDLAAVIDTPKALAALRNKSTLAYAYRLTTGVSKNFGERLYEAHASLENAASLVSNVDYKEEYFELAKEVLNLIRLVGKSLKEKNRIQMMIFKIGTIDKTQPHLLADLAEIVLLTAYNENNSLSKATLESIMKEMPKDPGELDGESDDIVPSYDLLDENIEDCWAQLEYRESVYEDYYPFKVEGAQLLWKNEQLTPEQRLYFFLLICSRLRSFQSRGFDQRAAKVFTKVSRQALVTIAGCKAQVRIFDSGSDDRRMYYGNNLQVAITKLAKDLGAVTNEKEIKKLSTSGDKGIDLVAIHQFSDGAYGSFAILGQCAAQEKNWPKKTLEACSMRLSGLFTCLLHPPFNLMFIPISYRTSSGDWVQVSDIGGCLLIDRLRILNLVKEDWNSTVQLLESECDPILKEVSDLGAEVVT